MYRGLFVTNEDVLDLVVLEKGVVNVSRGVFEVMVIALSFSHGIVQIYYFRARVHPDENPVGIADVNWDVQFF